MKEIGLTQGQVALVDDEDFEMLNQFKWYADKTRRGFCAVRNTRRVDGVCRTLRMHRAILNAPSSLEVDHINGNALDNRQQNSCNKKHPQKNNRLGVKGVCWNKERRRYEAIINLNGKRIHLGRFMLLADADNAYRAAEIKYFGEFARQTV